MSVLGIGIDVVALEGFAARLHAGGDMADRTFTAGERADAEFGDRDPTAPLAGRYAAKQAFVKAWSAARYGRPPAIDRVDLRAIEVRLDGQGRPALALHGEVAEELDALAITLELRGAIARHVSIAHDGPVATAVVVLSVTSLA